MDVRLNLRTTHPSVDEVVRATAETLRAGGQALLAIDLNTGETLTTPLMLDQGGRRKADYSFVTRGLPNVTICKEKVRYTPDGKLDPNDSDTVNVRVGNRTTHVHLK